MKVRYFVALALALGMPVACLAENLRGASTGPTMAKGYDHPNQYIALPAKQIADNMEPVMEHRQQADAANERLQAAAKKFGRKPNILIVLLDDVGWMDPGFNGGGPSVGNPTPNIDRLAHADLILTSAYSTPSCTPTRATIMTGQNPLHHDSSVRPCMVRKAASTAP